MKTRHDVLRHARSWLGTQESPAGSNRTPIGVKFGWNGVPWCAEFVWLVLHTAGFKVTKTASAPGLHDAMVRSGWKRVSSTNAKPGDIIFFNWPGTSRTIDHTGFVEGKQADGRVITLEGNTTLANGNGGVARRVRSTVLVSSILRPPYIRKTLSK